MHDMSKRLKQIINENIGVFDQIKSYYGCYETMKNGSLHTHTFVAQ